jgi:hypothetical protein
MSYQAGDTYPAQLTILDAAGTAADPDSLTLTVREPDGTTIVYVYGDDSEIVRDSEGIFHADIPVDAAGMWAFAWATTNEQEAEGVQVWVSPSAVTSVTFCTVADVATRLGRDLTDAEQGTVAMLCELVTSEMAAAADKDAAWLAALTEVQPPLRVIAIDVVTRLMRNPTGLSSTSETLGAYSYTQRFAGDGESASVGGMALTAREERRVRRLILGTSVGTIEVPSIFESELLLP